MKRAYFLFYDDGGGDNDNLITHGVTSDKCLVEIKQ
jgi:hypothetical protein